MERAFRELSDWTDDSRIFENDARKVFLTPGKKYNIKITSPEDILIAEALLKGREAYVNHLHPLCLRVLSPFHPYGF